MQEQRGDGRRITEPRRKAGQLHRTVLSAAPPFKNPDPFVPYGIGWVSVPEGLSILGIITGCKPEEIKMHMDVKLVVEKVWEDSEGNDVVTWKWKKI